MKKLDYYVECIKKGRFSVNFCSGCRRIHLDVGGDTLYLRKIRSKNTWFLMLGDWRFEARFKPLLGASPVGKQLEAVLFRGGCPK